MKKQSKGLLQAQFGVTLSGFLLFLLVAGTLLAGAMKVLPSGMEYFAARRAIHHAREGASSAAEIRRAFDRQAEVNDIRSISGRDLQIERRGEQFEVSFAYEKRIPLVGPASLVIDFKASTAEQ